MSTVVGVAPCTPTTLRCADARQYDHVLRPCCREHVIAITSAVAGALRANRVTFWADYGTLLGAVRNPMTTWADYPWLAAGEEPIAPGIVPHDKDSDFGALFTDWGRSITALRQVRRAHGYDLSIRAHRGSVKVRLSVKNHTNLDLFFWYRRPTGMLYRRAYAAVDAYKGKEFLESMLFPLGTVDWEGFTLPAPHDPESFLEMRYGPNWRTPVMANTDGVRRD